MLQKCCAAIFGFVIASEREATQLRERKKSAVLPPRSCFYHQLDCFAFARKDGRTARLNPPLHHHLLDLRNRPRRV